MENVLEPKEAFNLFKVPSKLENRRNTKIRSKTIPMITGYPTTDALYNLHLSDGRKFLNTLILGSIKGDTATFSFAGYDGMLVIKLKSGRRAFIKKHLLAT